MNENISILYVNGCGILCFNVLGAIHIVFGVIDGEIVGYEFNIKD